MRWRWIFFATAALAVALVVAGWRWWKGERDRMSRYDGHIAEAAQKYDISPDLIRAVVWQESDFDERATGRAQERGLMQVTPVAGQEWAKREKIADFKPEDLFDPHTNIFAGSWYLARSKRRWQHADEPELFALAEYNAGRSNALRWAKDLSQPVGQAFVQRIDYPSTKKYVASVQKRYQLYHQNRNPGPFTALWHKFKQRWR
ncbi:MAG: lytic transglycosylase domain-containing protein [bacterium]